MSETRPAYALPMLAVEEPTAELTLELLAVNGGAICFRTNAAYVIGLLQAGIADLELADLTRISMLNHAAVEELRERKKP